MRRGTGLCLVLVLALLAACGSSSAGRSSESNRAGVVLTARYEAQKSSDIDAVQEILLRRFRALGASDATVDVDRARHLVHIRLPTDQALPSDVQRLGFQTASLRFRPVVEQAGEPVILPFKSEDTKKHSCAALIAQSAPDTDDATSIWLPDRQRENCYLLGPVLVTGASIGNAGAVNDSTISEWVVNVHFDDDKFLDRIARPLVGKLVAIDLDGVVQSAPRINPGIASRDVEISGGFTEDEAKTLALVLRYGALPVQLEFVSATATP